MSGTYTFDRVVVVPVTADRSADRLAVEAGVLVADLATGTRTGLGWALRAVPPPVARAAWWCALIDPVARRVVRGVRTHGTAGNGRHEWYDATDQHRIVAVRAVEPPGVTGSPSSTGLTHRHAASLVDDDDHL